MKKYQIAILSVFVVSAIASLIEGKPAGAVLNVLIVFVLALIWRKKGIRKDTNAKSDAFSAKNNEPPFAVKVEQSQALLNAPKESVPDCSTQESIRTTKENFNVAGTSYRQEAIDELGTENPIYKYSKKKLIEEGYEDERIYQYEFFPGQVELIEEPNNPHDSNAIKVVIDGTHIGYIKAGSCSHVKKLLCSGTVLDVSAEIYGGKFKLLYFDDYKDSYVLETDSTTFGARVSIVYKK